MLTAHPVERNFHVNVANPTNAHSLLDGPNCLANRCDNGPICLASINVTELSIHPTGQFMPSMML